MARATFTFNGYAFQATGRPEWARTARYEADTEGAVPRRIRWSYSIAQAFTEDSFADNQARYAALLAALIPEGRLVITDENGITLVDALAKVESGAMPAQWGQHLLEVTVSFGVVERLGNALAISYNGVALDEVITWKQTTTTERASVLVANRRNVTARVAATGRVTPDPALPEADRRAYLQQRCRAINEAGNVKSGPLVGPQFSETVMVETIEATVNDAEVLTWSLTAYWMRYPHDQYVEVEYDFTQRDDAEASERTSSLRGKVRAYSEDAARAKAQAMQASYALNRVAKGFETDAGRISGADGDAFIELSFSAEYREPIPGGKVSYDLTVSDRDGLREGQIITTYAGRVTAAAASTALAKAQALGDNRYPFRMSASEAIKTASRQGSAEYLVEVTFSYEYLRKGSKRFAEVSSSTESNTFGASVLNISGSAVAPSNSEALTLARSFKQAGLLVRSIRETPQILSTGSGTSGNATMQVKVDFAYSFHLTAQAGSVQYVRRVAQDRAQNKQTITYTGTAFAPTLAQASALVDNVVAGQTGSKTSDERSDAHDSAQGINAFMSLQFSIGYVAPLPPNSGIDILQAEYSVRAVGSINHTVISEIPFGTPYVQQNCGVTIGSKTVSGSVTAINQNTAKSWGQGKKGEVNGGYAVPPEEEMHVGYLDLSGSVVTGYRFNFTYGARFTNLPL